MPNFAFLSLGRLYLVRDGAVTEITSRFGDQIRQRSLDLERRHAWKFEGAGARFMGMWAARPQGNAADMEIAITALAVHLRFGFAIKYWTDFADRHVRILAFVREDR